MKSLAQNHLHLQAPSHLCGIANSPHRSQQNPQRDWPLTLCPSSEVCDKPMLIATQWRRVWDVVSLDRNQIYGSYVMLGQGVKDFLRVRGANFGVRRILILSSDDTYILAQSMLLSLRRLTCHAMRCNINTTH
jgi:hypothetical protein